ncbi:MAG: S8 family serine peptidase [Candidatus Brocadia sp.]|jgi:subtilisin family serine protease
MYTVRSPAVADNAIAVASYITRTEWQNYMNTHYNTADIGYTNDTTIGAISSFSSRGPRIDGRKKPDIAAPGQEIISVKDKIITQSNYWYDDRIIIDNDGVFGGPAEYWVMQGTSMACPIAAGSAALLMQANPSLKGNPAAVRNALLQTASNNGTQDNTFGYGKINILAALNNDATCEGKGINAIPWTATVWKGSSEPEWIRIYCEDTNTGIAGEVVTWEVTKGAKKISVSPQSATTDIHGEAEFIIEGRKKGKAKVTFYSGDLKKSVKVNVKGRR